MSILDKLQQAWQSQRCATPAMNPDDLLNGVRRERRVALWADIFVISVLLWVGASMLVWAFRDIHRDWPWLIYSASDVWVVGFILLSQWRRRRHAAHYDEPLLAHVEWSIKDIEHRMLQDRRSFWWYILPLALGCMIPPAVLFAIDFSRHPERARPRTLLAALGFFAAVFAFVHLVMKYARRKADKKRRQELEALRALRDTLLNTEE